MPHNLAAEESGQHSAPIMFETSSDGNNTEADANKGRDDDLLTCLEAISNGDFTRKPQFNDPLSLAVARLAEQRAQSSIGALTSLVGQNVTANETAIAVGKVLASARSVDDSTGQISTNIAHLTKAINAITQTSDNATTLARSMATSSDQGRENAVIATEKMARIEDLVKTTAEKMTNLIEASGDISGMVETIGKIAAQTNLLALNATIEAARAGDAGKGFAVVASEVKNLSNQTANATQDIAERISRLEDIVQTIESAMRESADAVEDGTGMITALTSTVSEIGKNAGAVDHAMEEIATSLSNQSGAAKHIGDNVQLIAGQAEDTVKAAETVSTAIEDGLKVTQKSLDQISKYTIENKALLLAKAEHFTWKKNIMNMVINQVDDINSISTSDHLYFKMWIESPQTSQMIDASDLATAREQYQDMQDVARTMISKYQQGDTDGANTDIMILTSLSDQFIETLDRYIKAIF